jgi:DNA polymerase bacteriophage-type
MLWIDLESYSEADLRKVGAYAYAMHPSTEVLLFAYALDDAPVKLWDLTTGTLMPADLDAALGDNDLQICAHNAQFDRTVLSCVMGLDTPLHRWRCSMVKALAHSLPSALGQLGQALGLPEDEAKLEDGKKLIARFCKPAPKNHRAGRYDRQSHPTEWARFCEYAVQDVAAMRRVWQLTPSWNYPDNKHELNLWHLDQAINDRGFCVDMELVHAAIRASDRAQEELAATVAELTDGAVDKATQRDRLLEYLSANCGVVMDGLTKAHVTEALGDQQLPAHARRLLQVRQEAGKTSVRKYQALERMTCPDGRFRGGLQFAGADRTARWAGRGFQPQNLPSRGLPAPDQVEIYIEAVKAGAEDLLFDNVMLLSSAAIRGAVMAPAGKKIVAADLSNIEGRKLAWLAGEQWKLQAFRDFDAGHGHDLYKLAYSRSFSVEPAKVSKPQRDIGKVQELALGYQGGVGAFVTMAAGYGVDMAQNFPHIWESASARQRDRALYAWERDQHKFADLGREAYLAADIVKQGWRAANPMIERLWYDMERAAIAALHSPGQVFRAGRLVLRAEGQDWLRIKLPSGRFLCYYQPRVDDGGKLTYMGMYRRASNSKPVWTRIATYGGKLVENVTQASSRDVLAHNLPGIEAAGYELVLTVHDETVTEAPDTPDYNAEHLSALLAACPPWADGLPLAAGGFEAPRYRKD